MGRHLVQCDSNLYFRQQVEIQTRSVFFCTRGGADNKQLFDEMEALCEQRPAGTLTVSQEEVRTGTYQDKLRQFAYRLD